MELVAQFQITSVDRLPLVLLWQTVRHDAGVTKKEFDDYFAGLDSGVAIHISDVKKFRKSVSLDDLRRAWRGFHPPQGFRYLDAIALAKVVPDAIRRAA